MGTVAPPNRVDALVGRWGLFLIVTQAETRETTPSVEMTFRRDGSYVIRSANTDPVEGDVDGREQVEARTVAAGIRLPARALEVRGDTLFWTMSDGTDLVFRRMTS